MSHLECSGLEESLLQCNQRACYATGCTHFRRAGIICERKNFYSFYIAVKTLTAVCTSGSIRLGDRAKLRGRVEVCYNGSWVTICSHQWTVQEATVICSQLGYSRYGICIMHAVVLILNTGSIAIPNAYVNNEWPMGIYELQCAGNESSLWDCEFTTSYDREGCTQNNDVAVSLHA